MPGDMPGAMPAFTTGMNGHQGGAAHQRRGAVPEPEPARDAHPPEAEADDETDEQRQQRQQQEEQYRRRYRTRQCRICLDTVEPTFDPAPAGYTAFLQSQPRVRYVSDDPEYGKLLSPCKCKGSQRYVHEGCLRAWRESQPLRDRNYWKCPTCGFQYKMTRLKYSKWIRSKLTRVGLTLALFVIAVFVLGYVADPILSLWTDPLGTIVDTVSSSDSSWSSYDQYAYEPVDDMLREFSRSWYGHFAKGFFSLGIIGFLKTMVAASPFYWINLGIGGRRRRRGRMEDVNLLFVILGVVTFLGAAWKLIGYLCAKFLENVGETVMDVQPDGPDDDEDEEPPPAGEARPDQ